MDRFERERTLDMSTSERSDGLGGIGLPTPDQIAAKSQGVSFVMYTYQLLLFTSVLQVPMYYKLLHPITSRNGIFTLLVVPNCWESLPPFGLFRCFSRRGRLGKLGTRNIPHHNIQIEAADQSSSIGECGCVGAPSSRYVCAPVDL